MILWGHHRPGFGLLVVGGKIVPGQSTIIRCDFREAALSMAVYRIGTEPILKGLGRPPGMWEG